MMLLIFCCFFSAYSLYQAHLTLTGIPYERHLKFVSFDDDWNDFFRVNVSYGDTKEEYVPKTSYYAVDKPYEAMDFDFIDDEYYRFVHEVTFRNLPVGVPIYFQIYCEEKKKPILLNANELETEQKAICESSQIFETTIPDTEASDAFEFIVIGDTLDEDGQTNFRKIIDRIADVEYGKASVIIHNGDFVFSWWRKDSDEWQWDRYFRSYEDFNTKIPVMYSPGNHEGSYEFISFRERISSVAGIASNSHTSLYYSFNLGNIHFISLSTGKHHGLYDSPSEQLSWLERDLMGVDRTQFPHVVVYMHAPIYTTHKKHPPELEIRENLEWMFHKYDVTIVFAGHVHAYERLCQIHEEKCLSPQFNKKRESEIYNDDDNDDEDDNEEYLSDTDTDTSVYKISESGPVYVTVGCGGKNTRAVWEELDSPSASEYLVLRMNEYGYLKGISDLESNDLDFEFHMLERSEVKRDDEKFEIADSFSLVFEGARKPKGRNKITVKKWREDKDYSHLNVLFALAGFSGSIMLIILVSGLFYLIVRLSILSKLYNRVTIQRIRRRGRD